MRVKSIFAALLLLMVAGLQTANAQRIKVWQNGTFVKFNACLVDSITFIDDNYDAEHEYVDLGLPSGTLWATCNIGADSPEEYGDYFAWGETEPKSDYSASNYKFADRVEEVSEYNGYPQVVSVTKYCTDSRYGRVDNKMELDPEDDAATVNWGGDWQMPSQAQFDELTDESYTTTTWTTRNGINGLLIKSNQNGNSIFLPAAGGYGLLGNGNVLESAGSHGEYFTRTNCGYIDVEYTGIPVAGYFFSYSESCGTTWHVRFIGLSVRPVVKGSGRVRVKSIELNKTSINLQAGETVTLTATVLPEDAENKEVTWESSNTEVAKVDYNGKVTAMADGTATITCSATDGSGVKAECQVTVGEVPHDYVDLGLPSGTLWATCNVGASSPEEYGDYFAWGETTKKGSYTDATYTYNLPSGQTELEPSADAATVNWGENWQMPSAAQFDELINSQYTTIEQVYDDDDDKVIGYKITSKSNGKSIYFPTAGFKYDQRNFDGFYYWSRSVGSSDNYGYCLCGSSTLYNMSNFMIRSYGATVRPVVKGDGRVLVTKIELSETSINLQMGETKTLTATVFPENAENKEVTWASSNPAVAVVTNGGMVVALTNGTCTITCCATDGSGVKAECQVTVENPVPDTHEYVDLGLPSGTLWATCNVGANSPEEFGDYFAWGETTKKNKYTDATYTYELPAGSIELESSADAATVNWGENWQMPSAAQFDELINSQYTTIEQVYDDDDDKIIGYRITGKSNGKSIYLPTAGFKYDQRNFDGFYYWSRSVGSSDNYGYCLCGSSTLYNMSNYMIRSYGATVRPVRKQ